MDEGVEAYYADLLWTMRGRLDVFTKEIVALGRALRPELREAESWPVYIDDYHGVMCGKDGHGCEMEQEIILTPFEESASFPRFTARQLLDAIEEHIEQQKARNEERED